MCPEMVLLNGLHLINLTLKLVQHLHPLISFWLCNWHLPFFSYNTCLTFRTAKVRVTFSLERLIRLALGSSFRNSLGVWDVRVGHYRLRAFSQVVKDLQGITVSLVPVPKMRLFVPKLAQCFCPVQKTLSYSASFPFSSSLQLTRGMWLHFDLLSDNLSKNHPIKIAVLFLNENF